MATKTIITKDTIVFYMDYVLENGENPNQYIFSQN
jgi:hypothetical protein